MQTLSKNYLRVALMENHFQCRNCKTIFDYGTLQAMVKRGDYSLHAVNKSDIERINYCIICHDPVFPYTPSKYVLKKSEYKIDVTEETTQRLQKAFHAMFSRFKGEIVQDVTDLITARDEEFKK